MATKISRFRGALVGAVIGDCLGAHFEGSMQVSMKSVLHHFDAVKTAPENKEGQLTGHFGARNQNQVKLSVILQFSVLNS